MRMNRRRALAWASEQSDWVRAQLDAMPATEPFAPGAVIPLEGAETRLVWSPLAPRTPALQEGELTCGGPIEGFGRRVTLFLRRRALHLLSKETAAMAASAGLALRSVTVGDAATRWGSCSSAGNVRYSWRLILAPPDVRRYVVAHEVAHLAHLNHGPQFKALERQLFGGHPREARLLLRRLGPRLQRIGRGG